MMNEERTLFDPPILLQTIKCDECGKNLFQISELYEKDVCIRCDGCGARFTIFAEKAGELLARTLAREQKRQDRLSLSELLEIRLHSFELQIGEKGDSAAVLFREYVEGLFSAVIESVDGVILRRLRTRLFQKIKDKGIGEGPVLLQDIEAAAAEALRRSGYELQVDDDEEIEN